MTFKAWAPFAHTVELCVGGQRRPMNRVSREYWELTLPEITPEDNRAYRYAIDGGEPVPDPFSRWQPGGVHGDSWHCHWAKPAASTVGFRPQDLAEAVIYELHIGTFTPEGTYAAAREKLPHLASLGVTHVEVMPLATFPGHHGWGYDGVYLFAPHPAYGMPDELVEFVAACHAHGLAVLLDVVYNHFGPEGNYLAQYGPCFSTTNKTLWGDALNFDGPGSDGMRQLVLDNATYWLRDFGFDGLRLDAVHAIVDTSARHILEELAAHVAQLGQTLNRRLVLIAESDLNDPRIVRPVETGGYGIDAFWADDFHHAVHTLLTGEQDRHFGDFNGLRDVVRALREGYVYQGQYSPARRRRHGRPADGLQPTQLVYCLQNHDQIGNRAQGERLGMLVDDLAAKAAAVLLFFAPGVPLLFQGEEWGASTPFLYFTDHQDPELARAVSRGRATEFPTGSKVPDPQDPETYRRSQLDWEELEKPAHSARLAWYQRLIALRRRLAGSDCQVECDEVAQWLTVRRGQWLALFNFSSREQPVPRPAGSWQVELTSDENTEVAVDAILPAGVTRVLRLVDASVVGKAGV